MLPESSDFKAFSGVSARLDGKKRAPTRSECEADAVAASASAAATSALRAAEYVRGIPDYDYEIGTIRKRG